MENLVGVKENRVGTPGVHCMVHLEEQKCSKI